MSGNKLVRFSARQAAVAARLQCSQQVKTGVAMPVSEAVNHARLAVGNSPFDAPNREDINPN